MAQLFYQLRHSLARLMGEMVLGTPDTNLAVGTFGCAKLALYADDYFNDQHGHFYLGTHKDTDFDVVDFVKIAGVVTFDPDLASAVVVGDLFEMYPDFTPAELNAAINLALAKVEQEALQDKINATLKVAATWAVATVYVVGDRVLPVTANNYAYQCTVAGTSHATTEPTWPTTVDGTVVDGAALTWSCQGLYEYLIPSGFVRIEHIYQESSTAGQYSESKDRLDLRHWDILRGTTPKIWIDHNYKTLTAGRHLRLVGQSSPAQLTLDADSCAVNPNYIVSQAKANLHFSRASEIGDEHQKKMVVAQTMADRERNTLFVVPRGRKVSY